MSWVFGYLPYARFLEDDSVSTLFRSYSHCPSICNTFQSISCQRQRFSRNDDLIIENAILHRIPIDGHLVASQASFGLPLSHRQWSMLLWRICIRPKLHWERYLCSSDVLAITVYWRGWPDEKWLQPKPLGWRASYQIRGALSFEPSLPRHVIGKFSNSY